MLHPQADDRLVFTSPEGGEIDYSNWRLRRWAVLLEATAPDAEHPGRKLVAGNPHMPGTAMRPRSFRLSRTRRRCRP